MLHRAGRASVDRWLDDLFRTRLGLMSPRSPSLESVYAYDSAGQPVLACGNGPAVVPCRDDSGGFNASIRATDRLAQYGSDWAFFTTLDPRAQDILWLQRQPVWCHMEAGIKRKRHTHADGSQVELLICRACDAPGPVKCPDEPVRARGNAWQCGQCGGTEKSHWLAMHRRCVRVRVERRLDDRRDGDGSELVKSLGDGWWTMDVLEPVQAGNDGIARQLGIGEGELVRLVKRARARIREKLEGAEKVE